MVGYGYLGLGMLWLSHHRVGIWHYGCTIIGWKCGIMVATSWDGNGAFFVPPSWVRYGCGSSKAEKLNTINLKTC